LKSFLNCTINIRFFWLYYKLHRFEDDSMAKKINAWMRAQGQMSHFNILILSFIDFLYISHVLFDFNSPFSRYEHRFGIERQK
jgi:hypothetical protein